MDYVILHSIAFVRLQLSFLLFHPPGCMACTRRAEKNACGEHLPIPHPNHSCSPLHNHRYSTTENSSVDYASGAKLIEMACAQSCRKVREFVYRICLITPKCPLRPHARGALGIFGCYATHLPPHSASPLYFRLCVLTYTCAYGSIQSDLDSGAAVAAKRHGKKPWFSVMQQSTKTQCAGKFQHVLGISGGNLGLGLACTGGDAPRFADCRCVGGL